MSDVGIVFGIVLVTIALFVWNRLPVIVVAMASALALNLTGILTLNERLAGFGDPAILFIAALFIVTAGLEATGVTTWVGQRFEHAVAGSERRLRIVAMLAVTALCPLINASGAVGALMPVVLLLVMRLRDSAARHLMPLAFASGAGSHLALAGAPKNVLISDAAFEYGYATVGFFEFALVGLPLLAGTIAIVALLGDRLLPQRAAENLPPDLSRFAQTMVEQYRLSTDTYRLEVCARSPLIGSSPARLDLSEAPGLRLLTVTDRAGAPRLAAPLRAGDRVMVRGPVEAARRLAAAHDLEMDEISGPDAAAKLINRLSGVAEAVIAPRSQFIGRRVFPGMLTEDRALAVIAIQRRGEDILEETELQAGDYVLLQGDWDAIDRRRDTRGVLLVDKPAEVRRQVIALGVGARAMLAIVGVMVVLIATGWTAPALAALLAAGATLVLGVVTPERAYRAVNWTTVILMAGMFPLSTALFQTGAAQLVADGLVALTGDAAPRILLAGIFTLGVGLGIVISNTATCLILIPIAVLSAEAFGISALPVLFTLSIATSASFLTPVSTPVNTMVMGPAGYLFGDYWRLGLPLTILYFVVAVGLTPLIWPF